MKILIGCESSGTVREAFRRKGHDAWSCDILPADDDSDFHIVGNVLDVMDGDWDMAIFHPPCTYLTCSGLHWNKRVEGRAQKTEDALEFVRKIMECKIDKWAIENPVGCISTRIRKPDQKIQPWQFGHDASKGTCLWLKNLPKLKSTNIIPPKGWSQVKYASDCVECFDCGEPYCTECQDHYADCECIGPTMDDFATYKKIEGYEFAIKKENFVKPVWSNQTPSGQNKLGPSKDRWKIRSKTYYGIARAMSEQWG